MYKRVLVPLDGSQEAEKAVPVAARLASAHGGSLVLVRVVRAPVEFELGVVPPATWAPAAEPESREEAVAYLHALQCDPLLTGVHSDIAVYAGPPAAMVLTAAASAHANLVVMTSHGRTGLGRWMLGSVASEVVQESSIPVLVIRGSALGAPQEGPPPALSALVPLDGSHLAEAALLPALQLLVALADNAPIALRLLSVVEPLPLTETASLTGGVAGKGQVRLTDVDKTMLGEAEEYLCSIAEQVRREAGKLLPGRSVAVTWSAVWNPDVAHTIVSAAESGSAAKGSTQQENRLPPSDLIALATHGHGGLRRWVMGSIADRVLHATHLPLLVVRPAEVALTPAADHRT